MSNNESTNYYDIKAISQSSLKLLDYSPLKFYETEYSWIKGISDSRVENKSTEAMEFGSLVDCRLLTPEEFDSKYVVYEGVVPTGQLRTFIDNLLEAEKETDDISLAQQLAYDRSLIKRDSLQKFLTRLDTEGKDFYQFMKTGCKDRIIVSKENLQHCDEIIARINSNRYIQKILRPELDCQDVFFQVPVTGEFEGFPVKGLIDILFIDNKLGTVLPVDLKTTSESFRSSYINRRYDLQGAFYSMLAASFIKELRNYKVEKFCFIAASTTSDNVDFYEMSDRQLRLGEIGGINDYSIYVKGYRGLIEDLKWHESTGIWEVSKEVYLNNGKKIIT